MNILFTCAGRRNYLLEYFRQINGIHITACDASIYAPALYTADEHFIVPEVYDKNYIKILINEAKARKINTIIPLNDLELPILAVNKSKFEKEGIKVIVSDKVVVDTCFDKLATVTFSQNLSVNQIPTFTNPEDAIKYKKEHPECSFIIKPRWGTGSISMGYPQNELELVRQYDYIKKKILESFLNEISSNDYDKCILIQKKIEGQEYGIDVINNLNAEYEATLIRKKIAMRSGETDKAETIFDDRILKIGKEIGNKLKHIGNLDCDLFIDNEDIYLLEMNPRFGGGYPFMHYAGVNLPLAIVEWINGNKTPNNCFNYKDGLVLAKFDQISALFSK